MIRYQGNNNIEVRKVQYKISIIGGGSWGTALAQLLAKNGYNVLLYVREKTLKDSINNNNENPVYLPGVKLNSKIKSAGFEDIDNQLSENLVWAVPGAYSAQVCKELKDNFKNKNVLIASKGIDFETKNIIYNLLAKSVNAHFSIISGPSFAVEVINSKPTAVSIASKNITLAKFWQKCFSSDSFRIYTTDDVLGVGLGGALKNVIAIATGVSDGLDLGYSARAAIITRGLAEITRLGVKMGGRLETFMGLSGLGDLVLTCTSELSRNKTVGKKLAEGLTIEKILKELKGVPEGIYTVKAAKYLQIFYQVEMPITDEVYKILYENKNVAASIVDLMSRPLRDESV